MPFVVSPLGLLCLGAVVSTGAAKPEFPRLGGAKISKPPVIDGKLEPGEWDGISQTGPLKDRVTGVEPTADPTVAWIGYDNAAIYVAFRCDDSEPGKIIGREVQPNSEFRGEDTVTLDLNLFGTRSYDQLNEFIVNAIGTQTERIAGGRSSKREWRGEWQAKTSIDDRGWVCEMRIPWKMLNYPAKDRLNIDLNLIRRQGRSLREQSWANARQNPLPELQGMWESVTPPKPPKPKPQFLAYQALDASDGNLQLRQGFDAKYAFTSSLSGLLSVAPDFRNVEDVVAGNDFVRVERQLNDPRPFFQEGGNFYELNDRNGGYGRMFYSRRIEDFDFGIKTFGLLNPNLALGTLHTRGNNGEDATILKLTNTVSGTKTQKFFLTESLLGGTRNQSAGFGLFNRVGTVGFNFDTSVERSSNEDWDSAGSISVNYTRPTTFAGIRYKWVEPGFNPSLGIIPWTDRRGLSAFSFYNRQYRQSWIRDINGFFFFDDYRTYSTNVLQQGGYSAGIDWSTKSDLGVGFSKTRQTFSGSLDDVFGAFVRFNKTNRFRQFGFSFEDGTRGDQTTNYYALDGTWRVGKNFDVGFRQSVLSRGTRDEQTVISALYQASQDTTFSTRVVSTPAGTNAYASFRKAGNAGTEYYLILGDPNAPTTQTRLSLKLVWAF